MSLSIKQPEAHRLARELADLTGESMTAAIIKALEERIERVRRDREGLAQRLRQIAHEAAPHFDSSFKSEDIADMLYDEHGLPK